MTLVRDVEKALFEIAPKEMKYDWDNVGLLCGHEDRQVTKLMVALDPMLDVLAEAKEAGAELVVSHHPVIFGSIQSVSDRTLTGRNLLFLIENGMAAINMHTNLDCAPGGVNDCLAAALELNNLEVMDPVGTDKQGRPYGLIRLGNVSQTTLPAFAAFVKKRLGCAALRYSDGGKHVHRVAVGGGACGSEIETVLLHGCDTFVTADLKYNQMQEAKYYGLNLIDAGHFETENPVCWYLRRYLAAKFPEVEVLQAKNHKSETQFL